jgi:hypothetical protein
VLEKSNPVLLDLDYDLLSTTDPARFIRWMGVSYANLGAFQAGQPQEANAVAAIPDLENPAGGNFTPRSTSAALDRGLVIPGINDGFAGAAPDLGAVELNNGLFRDGFE